MTPRGNAPKFWQLREGCFWAALLSDALSISLSEVRDKASEERLYPKASISFFFILFIFLDCITCGGERIQLKEASLVSGPFSCFLREGKGKRKRESCGHAEREREREREKRNRREKLPLKTVQDHKSPIRNTCSQTRRQEREPSAKHIPVLF